jgi:penicillin V acylase-like amidase (Ntn superfamily)
MEWGTFDLHSTVAIIPRGYSFTGLTPDGHNGKKWNAKYGVVGLDMLERDLLADGMDEKGLGIPVQAHWMVTEPSGKSIVIEYLDNELRIFDNPLGVITNSPSYDWHMINLRNSGESLSSGASC